MDSDIKTSFFCGTSLIRETIVFLCLLTNINRCTHWHFSVTNFLGHFHHFRELHTFFFEKQFVGLWWWQLTRKLQLDLVLNNPLVVVYLVIENSRHWQFLFGMSIHNNPELKKCTLSKAKTFFAPFFCCNLRRTHAGFRHFPGACQWVLVHCKDTDLYLYFLC